MESFRLLQSAGLQDMPLAFFHQVQGVLWPETDVPHDILTGAEIEVIVKNYNDGGSVRQLARQFWQAQEEMRLKAEPLTPVKEKGLVTFGWMASIDQKEIHKVYRWNQLDELKVLAGGLTSLVTVPLVSELCLWEAWEENRAIRKLSRKKGSLLEWEDPSKVRKYFEEIDITPKPGMIYCTSHSLKMFMSYINRRNDGSKRKDHRLKAIFDAVGKHWQPKIRSRRTLAVQDEEEPAEEEAEEEEEEALTEAEEEDGQPCEVDAYLAESMGLVTGSPQPASAYVGTVAYELDAETEQVVPYQAQVPAESIDLVRELAELEHLASKLDSPF
ncbi:unnamed protein product [Symbiodinium sp. CCMP2456]|nr:unnamed protein product [Symbiodinium sp. CCMP2456]